MQVCVTLEQASAYLLLKGVAVLIVPGKAIDEKLVLPRLSHCLLQQADSDM